MNTLNEMLSIKNQYNELKSKVAKLKTKSAKEKYFDKLSALRRSFKKLQFEIDWSNFDVSKLNLMAPCSGPIHLVNAENFKNEGFYFTFNFKGDKTRYVGEYSLLEDKCGIDNLKILMSQISA